MKKRLIFFVIVLMAFMSGCSAFNANDSKSEEDQQIRENAWTYVKGTEMPVDAEWESAWLNGEVEEVERSRNTF